ncbi:MAG: hypothetical protein ACE5EM_12560 [Sphingomonadales bacterium]
MTLGQLALELPHRPGFSYDDLLLAPSNEEAAMWIDRWPDWPGHALALHGPEGCGKTHLAHVWQEATGARVIDGRDLDTPGIVARLEPGQCVALENFPAGGSEVTLFHLFNWTKEQGGYLLLTGRQPPARWDVQLKDLRSRLRGLHAVALGAPDDAMLRAILVKLFADRQLIVSEEILNYLLTRIERTFVGAEAAVRAIDRLALAEKRRITVPLARVALEEGGRQL